MAFVRRLVALHYSIGIPPPAAPSHGLPT